MKNILTEKFSKTLLIIGLILLILGFTLFIWNDWNLNNDNQLNSEKVAQFGDLVGGLIGSIWALAGVILFYVALTEQRKDFSTNRKVLNAQTDALKQQIKEFELQREELSETRKVFTIQTKTLKIQQFESTFFNLLNLHHQIVNSIDLVSYEKNNSGKTSTIVEYMEVQKKPGERVITTGRDTFVKFRKGLKNEYKELKKENNGETEVNIVNLSYKNYYRKHQSDLGHYFRNLYHIFKFINNSDIEDKSRYTSLVRAQLSNDELFLLFYNSISENGKDKFKPLIEKYHLLKNLNQKELINEVHSEYHKSIAYKR
jgi:hypothetical protein